MAERSAIFCDNCGRVKGEANHWTKVVKLQSGGVAIADSDEALSWIAGAVHGMAPLALDILDACSSECEMKMIAKIREKTA